VLPSYANASTVLPAGAFSEKFIGLFRFFEEQELPAALLNHIPLKKSVCVC
jgi:hypothetical protein